MLGPGRLLTRQPRRSSDRATCSATDPYVGPSAWGKTITQSEYNSYLQVGIDVWLVFERATGDWVGGHAAGAANAQIALQHTPAEYSGPIYMACDAELLGFDLDIALGYIRGASSVLAPERTGVYGEGALCEMVYNYGYATWCWQSASTSFPGNATTLAITDIQQGPPGPIPGTDPDIFYDRERPQPQRKPEVTRQVVGYERFVSTGLASIEEAIEAIASGGMVVVVDDEDRENEGDLVMAAEFATPEKIAFFLSHTSGLICAPVLGERLDELDLPLMVTSNTESQRTAFTVSVDFRHGTTSGISAADRARTISAFVDPATRPDDLARPGHIFPLRYRPGGVLKRAGHTEATIDLVSAAGLFPAGVLCEIVSEDKTGMARLPELQEFAARHELPLVTIADLVRYRSRKDKLVRQVARARIPTKLGELTCFAYESVLDGEQHLAVVMGDVAGCQNVLVRVHSECLTGDVLGSLRCDCGPQLHSALELIAAEGRGVVVYLRGHEGRGIGIAHKLRAYSLQEQGRDTVDANIQLGLPVDSREYGIGAQILVDLGVTTMRLMTNNPAKYKGLEGFGLEIVERVPLEASPTPENIGYLRTKRERMGHLLGELEIPQDAETPTVVATGAPSNKPQQARGR